MAALAPNTTPSEQAVVIAGLGRALVQHRLLRIDEAVAIQKKADAAHSAFIDELIAGNRINPLQIARFAAET